MGALPSWDEYVSEEEYLELLEKSVINLDWIDGRIYPRHNPYRLLPEEIAGASDSHIDISVTLLGVLGMQLRGTSFRVVNHDQKVAGKTSVLFPDITVYCGEREKDSRGNLLNPVLICEVLSPETVLYDRGGAKWEKLRDIATLQDYLLVSQNRLLVEHRRRIDALRWNLIYYNRPDDIVPLESIGTALPISEIYERISFVD
jgi:Uma2 family endonuclease